MRESQKQTVVPRKNDQHHPIDLDTKGRRPCSECCPCYCHYIYNLNCHYPHLPLNNSLQEGKGTTVPKVTDLMRHQEEEKEQEGEQEEAALLEGLLMLQVSRVGGLVKGCCVG